MITYALIAVNDVCRNARTYRLFDGIHERAHENRWNASDRNTSVYGHDSRYHDWQRTGWTEATAN
jgi:hypothetical protein